MLSRCREWWRGLAGMNPMRLWWTEADGLEKLVSQLVASGAGSGL